jgi:hypothetical protein
MHWIAKLSQPYYLPNRLSNLMKNCFKKANCLHIFAGNAPERLAGSQNEEKKCREAKAY